MHSLTCPSCKLRGRIKLHYAEDEDGQRLLSFKSYAVRKLCRFRCIQCGAKFNACVYSKCLGSKCDFRIDCLAFEIFHVKRLTLQTKFEEVTSFWAKATVEDLLSDF